MLLTINILRANVSLGGVTPSKQEKEVMRLTNTEMLKQAVDDSGITIVALADKMGCSRGRIYNILAGEECKASEIVKICEILHLTQRQRDQIFFAKKVTVSNVEG